MINHRIVNEDSKIPHVKLQEESISASLMEAGNVLEEPTTDTIVANQTDTSLELDWDNHMDDQDIIARYKFSLLNLSGSYTLRA